MASQQRCDVIFEAAVMETSQGNCKATSNADMKASQSDNRPTKTPDRKLRWRTPGLTFVIAEESAVVLNYSCASQRLHNQL